MDVVASIADGFTNKSNPLVAVRLCQSFGKVFQILNLTTPGIFLSLFAKFLLETF